MTDRFVNRVDDGLAVGAYFVDILVEIEQPAKRLLRRRDVVALGAEHDNRRTDVAQVDRALVGGLDSSGGQVVADEQFVDDELDLLGIEVDVTAPPALELQIPL